MESKKYRVFIDAMGGDYAPAEVVKGAVRALGLEDIELILTGNQKKIDYSAREAGLDLSQIQVIEAKTEVSMDQSPSEVIKHYQDSSLYVAASKASQIKNGAFLSAGNTGAAMACALFNLKRIPGVLRPAIAVVIPLGNQRMVLLDAGANVDCKPQYLKQFAIMGKVYAQNILNISNPKIGLLNIGGEEKKGNELTLNTYPLLKESNINFFGNVEARELFGGVVDVAVCDGFIGNILLKSVEGLASLLLGEVKRALTANIFNKILALGLKNSLGSLKKKFDYEEYGGAYLLGLNGVTVISHGSSREKAIFNAIRVAYEGIKTNLVEKIRQEINSNQ
ncbi:MAG: phosphate acyltransferase PlsX [Actinomycetota bacterium]|nr:phosphate acyltransferase PlsX [Actinomycetota bacterium]